MALNGNAYAEASVRRIGVLARSDKEAAAGVLERIVEKRKGKVQARALLILSGLVGDKRRTELEDRLIEIGRAHV